MGGDEQRGARRAPNSRTPKCTAERFRPDRRISAAQRCLCRAAQRTIEREQNRPPRRTLHAREQVADPGWTSRASSEKRRMIRVLCAHHASPEYDGRRRTTRAREQRARRCGDSRTGSPRRCAGQRRCSVLPMWQQVPTISDARTDGAADAAAMHGAEAWRYEGKRPPTRTNVAKSGRRRVGYRQQQREARPAGGTSTASSD